MKQSVKHTDRQTDTHPHTHPPTHRWMRRLAEIIRNLILNINETQDIWGVDFNDLVASKFKGYSIQEISELCH